MSGKTHAWWLTYGNRVMTGLGIAGMVGTSVLSAWGMYKAMRKVEDKAAELKRPLTPKEKFKYTWYYFMPAGTSAVVSGVFLFGASQKAAKVNASLAADYAASQATMALLKEKTEELVGETKANAIQRSVIEDKMMSVPTPEPKASNTLIVAGGKHVLFFDVPSKRYFYSDVNTVKNAFLTLSDRLGDELAIQWNDLYDEIHSPELERLPGSGTTRGFVVHGTKCRIDYTMYAMELPDGSDTCFAVDYTNALENINWGKVMHGDGS